jgi:hypothetical protein
VHEVMTFSLSSAATGDKGVDLASVAVCLGDNNGSSALVSVKIFIALVPGRFERRGEREGGTSTLSTLSRREMLRFPRGRRATEE